MREYPLKLLAEPVKLNPPTQFAQLGVDDGVIDGVGVIVLVAVCEGVCDGVLVGEAVILGVGVGVGSQQFLIISVVIPLTLNTKLFTSTPSCEAPSQQYNPELSQVLPVPIPKLLDLNGFTPGPGKHNVNETEPAVVAVHLTSPQLAQLGVDEGVMVGVIVGVAVLVGVIDGVIEGVKVGVADAVILGVGVIVFVGVIDGVGVFVLVGVKVGVSDGVILAVGVMVFVGVIEGVCVFVGVIVGVGVLGTHSPEKI